MNPEFFPSQDSPTAPLNSESVLAAAQQETHRLGPRPPAYISAPITPANNAPMATLEKVGSLTHNLSWKDRNIFKHATQFGPDTDGFVAIITPQAIREIREGVRRASPNEAFGKLMGQTYRDDYGIFTLVSGCVYTSRLNATPENFKLSGEQMNELRRAASQAHPTADFVGWTHSHGSYSGYSSIDRREQAFWEEYNIGILTFMNVNAEKNWVRAYRGPTSRELSLKKISGSTKTNGSINSSIENISATSSAAQDEDIPGTQRIEVLNRPNWLSTGLAVLTILLLLGMALVLSNILFSTEARVETLNSQVTLLNNKIASLSADTSAASTNFIWNCDAQYGIAPLKVSCNGPVGPAIKSWSWHFGDSTTQETNSVTHTYQSPGTYTITLTIIAFGHQQALGSQEIFVGSPVSTQTTTRG